MNHIQINNCCNHVICLTNKCCISKSINYNITLILLYVLIHVYILKNIHPRCCILDTLCEPTPELASQWPTQKLYEIIFFFKKECGHPYDFCRGPTMLAR